MWTMGGIEATRLTLAPANRPPFNAGSESHLPDDAGVAMT